MMTPQHKRTILPKLATKDRTLYGPSNTTGQKRWEIFHHYDNHVTVSDNQHHNQHP